MLSQMDVWVGTWKMTEGMDGLIYCNLVHFQRWSQLNSNQIEIVVQMCSGNPVKVLIDHGRESYPFTIHLVSLVFVSASIPTLTRQMKSFIASVKETCRKTTFLAEDTLDYFDFAPL